MEQEYVQSGNWVNAFIGGTATVAVIVFLYYASTMYHKTEKELYKKKEKNRDSVYEKQERFFYFTDSEAPYKRL